MSQPAPTHATWSNRLAYILAATGAAVGLGNIWKCPYMMGENGGAAFLLVYLACVLAIGIPADDGAIVFAHDASSNRMAGTRTLAPSLELTMARQAAMSRVSP